MTDAQKLTIKRYEKAWIVDTNFQNEPIVYTYIKDSNNIEEYVVAQDGTPTHTGTYPYTVRLRNELKRY